MGDDGIAPLVPVKEEETDPDEIGDVGI